MIVMKVRKYFLIMIFLTFVSSTLTLEVSAMFCDTSEIARQKQIATHVRYSKNYSIRDDMSLDFFVELYNVRENHIIYLNGRRLNKDDLEKNNNEAYILPVSENRVSKIDIVLSDDIGCENNNLKTMYVNYPKHNEFYNHEICLGREMLRQCDRWFNHNLSESEFVSLVESRLTPPDDDIEDDDEYDETLFEFIMYYVTTYYYIWILLTIISLLIFKKYQAKDDFDLKT